MIPTITANIEPHVRLSVTEDEPAPVEEKFVDLECGVTESPSYTKAVSPKLCKKP